MLKFSIFPDLKENAIRAQKSAQKVIKNLDIVESEGERLTTLINELLDLAKIEAGKVEWKMTEVHPAELIDRATAATAALFEQKPALNLTKEIPDDLPEITADRDRIIQVLINLISNAVKFTETGEITIGVKVGGGSKKFPPTNPPQGGKQSFHYKEEASQVQASNTSLESNIQHPDFANARSGSASNPAASNQQLVFFVADTGTGIPPEHLDRIFEKFQQVEDNQSGKPKGTGLGLPICKEIVVHHGGRIWVESHAPGAGEKGSVFRFSLPTSQ